MREFRLFSDALIPGHPSYLYLTSNLYLVELGCLIRVAL